jgi:hypothetical protein
MLFKLINIKNIARNYMEKEKIHSKQLSNQNESHEAYKQNQNTS